MRLYEPDVVDHVAAQQGLHLRGLRQHLARVLPPVVHHDFAAEDPSDAVAVQIHQSVHVVLAGLLDGAVLLVRDFELLDLVLLDLVAEEVHLVAVHV